LQSKIHFHEETHILIIFCYIFATRRNMSSSKRNPVRTIEECVEAAPKNTKRVIADFLGDLQVALNEDHEEGERVLKRLKSELSEAVADKQRLRKDLQEATERLRVFEVQVVTETSKQKTIDTLTQKVASLQDTNQQRKNEVDSLRAQVGGLQNQVAGLRGELNGKEIVQTGLNISITLKTSRIERLNSEVRVLRSDVRRYTQDYVEEHSARQSLEAKIVALKQHYRTKMFRHIGEKRRAKNELRRNGIDFP
jgi:chromosome segregation ATPase